MTLETHGFASTTTRSLATELAAMAHGPQVLTARVAYYAGVGHRKGNGP